MTINENSITLRTSRVFAPACDVLLIYMLFLLPGQNRRDVLTGLSHPYGITVLDQHLYWTDWGTLSVQRVDKKTALDRATIRSSLGNLMDIKAWKVIADGNAIHRPLDFHLTSGSRSKWPSK